MSLTLITERADDAIVVTAAGDLDVATAPDLWQELEPVVQSAAGVAVVIDVAAVEFIDSTGLGSLVRLAKEAKAAGGTLMLRSPSPHVRKLLSITSLDNVLPVQD